MNLIALLTDFGLRDAYVGAMKGVILGIAPHARLVDLSHEISPQDVRAGAFVLWSAYRYFPSGTVFCAVVDPGVGSARRALAAHVHLEGRDYYCVGPDNGLLTPLALEAELAAVVALEDPRYRRPLPSATFHGRDVFAPAAAHLACGVALEELGPPLNPAGLMRLDWPRPERLAHGWRGAVIHVDGFGNLVTNLAAECLAGTDASRWLFRLAGREIRGLVRCYAEVAAGQALAYLGSSGLLELAVREGSAATVFGACAGTPVEALRLTSDRAPQPRS
jgi:S-adenosylmethionine hydrolase